MIAALLKREARKGLTGGGWLPAIFFMIVCAVVPFAVGPDAPLLARLGPGAMWIAALTAALLPIERLVEPDRADGVLDQLVVRGMSEEAIAAAKIGGHWLAFAPLLLVAAIPASALLGMDGDALVRALVSLAVGSLALAALAVAVAALTAGLGRAAALGGILLAPLAIPLMIFGVGASAADGGGALKLLAATSIFLTVTAPFAAGAAIRASRS